MKSRSAIGFTLIELMVTITMIAIVLTVAVPSFQASIRNSVLTAGINEFVAALNFARGEAIKMGVNVTVAKTSKTVGYEGGWQVFTDFNADGQLNSDSSGADQLLRTHGPLNTGYTLRGNGDNVTHATYLPNGTISPIGYSFALCDATQTLTGSTARVVAVNTLGRISMVTTDNKGNLQTTMTTCKP